jgi:PAS domain S-box-containing protein
MATCSEPQTRNIALSRLRSAHRGHRNSYRAAPRVRTMESGLDLYGVRKNGTEFPVEISLSPLEPRAAMQGGSAIRGAGTGPGLSAGAGVLVATVVRDISARRSADEHLAQLERRYYGLLEAAPDAMVVVDQTGAIVLLNLRAENQFGYSRDELVGQRVTAIIPAGFAERLIADGTRTAADALAQQIGTGIELTGRRKNGSEFPMEIMLSPLNSAEGVLVTAAIRDITDRKRAELQLMKTVGALERSNEELAQFAHVASHDRRSPCAWSPVTPSCWPSATPGAWTPRPMSSSPLPSTARSGCRA